MKQGAGEAKLYKIVLIFNTLMLFIRVVCIYWLL